MEQDERSDALGRFHQLLLCFRSQRVPFDLFKRACELKATWSPVGELSWRGADEGSVPGWLVDWWHSSQGLLAQGGAIPGLDGVQLVTDCGVCYFELQGPQQGSPDADDAEEEISFHCVHAFNHAFPCRNTDVLGGEIISHLMPLAKSFLLPLLASLSAVEVENLLPSGPEERKIEYAICLLDCLQQISIRLGTENPLLPIHFPQKVIDAIGRGAAEGQEVQSQIPLNMMAVTTFLSLEALHASSILSWPRDLEERCIAWAGSSLAILSSTRSVRASQSLSNAVTEAVRSWRPRSVTTPSAMEYLVATEILPEVQLKTIAPPESLSLELSMVRGYLLSRKGARVEAVTVLRGTFMEAIARWGPASFQVGIAAAEAASCYNILREEGLAQKIATRFLRARKTPGLKNRRDWFYLELALVDALIGSRKYEDAASTLQMIISQPSIPATIHMMSCLRLSKVHRRLQYEAGRRLASDGPLHAGVRLFTQVPEVLREEYLEELWCSLSEVAGATKEDSKRSETLIDAVGGLLEQKCYVQSPARARYAQVQVRLKQRLAKDAMSTAASKIPVVAAKDDMPTASQRLFSVPHQRDTMFLEPRLHDVPIPLYKRFQEMVDGPQATHLNVFVVSGNPGVGKTSNVLEIVYSYRQHFDVVLWLEAGPSVIADSFFRAAKELGLANPEYLMSTDRTYSRDLVLKWLCRPLIQSEGEQIFAKWLVVFDGAEDDETIREFYPRANLGTVIITTRNSAFNVSSIVTTPTTANIFKIHPLSIEQTLDLLCLHTELEELILSTREMRFLAKVMDNTNLQSILARTMPFIPKKAISLQAFIVLNRHKLDPKALPTPKEIREIAENPRHNIAQVALWMLGDSKPRREALMIIISLLSPDDIPESFLWPNPGCSGWNGYPQTNSAYEEARDWLLRLSLVWRTNRMTSLSTSPAIQDISKERILDEGLSFNYVYGKALNMFFHAWPCKFKAMAFPDFFSPDHSDCSCLWPHALSLKNHFSLWRPSTTASEETLQQLDCVLRISWCAITRCSYADATSFIGMATAILEAAIKDPALKRGRFSNADMDILFKQCTLHHHKGWLAQRNERQNSAEQHFSTCISQARKLLQDIGPEEPEWATLGIMIAAAYNGLGKVFLKTRKHQQARRCFKSSIDTLEDTGGSIEQYLATVRVNLGHALLLSGKEILAQAVFDEALFGARFQFWDPLLPLWCVISDFTGNKVDRLREASWCYGAALAKADDQDLDLRLELLSQSLDLYKMGTSDYHPMIGRIHLAMSDVNLRQNNHDLGL
ncbi:hypothetical protein ACJ41O_010803 [Fusarium nematophilum]